MQLYHGKVNWKSFLTNGPPSFIILFALIVLSPLIVARLLPIEPSSISTKEFAIGAGLVSLMMFLISFLLTGRFNFVSKKRGIDLTLIFHRRIVIIATLLSITHIVMIAPFGMPDNLLIMLVLLVLILSQIILAKTHSKIRFKYELWRLMHEIWAIAIVLIILSHAVAEGNYSSHPVMIGFWLILVVIAIGSLLYIHHYLPIKNAKKPYNIVEIKEMANKQWNIVLEPNGFKALEFHAGQFVFVSFGWTPIRNLAHPFSISSAPADRPRISLTIKETGDFTRKISKMDLNTQVYLFGPYGHFNRDLHKGPPNRGIGSVMIAGGIGITPMLSMLRQRKHEQDHDPVKLFYACRHQQDILFKEELLALAKDSNVEINFILSKPDEKWQGMNGRIDAAFLQKHITFDDYEHYLYFICGTTNFTESVVQGLELLDEIPLFNIIFEDFSVYS